VDPALILLHLALYLPSTFVFGSHGAVCILKKIVTFFTLPFSELSLAGFMLL